MKKIILTLSLLVTLFLTNEIMAQPAPGGGGPTNCWPPSTCIPIDGGIGFLIAAAAAFGAKKLYDKRK